MTMLRATDRTHKLFYMSVGEHEVFYTMRQRTITRFGDVDHHVCNLSMDLEEAVKKINAHFNVLKQRLELNPVEGYSIGLIDEPEGDAGGKRAPKHVSRWEMECILKLEEGIMPFGKHKDIQLADCPDSYITWLADQYKEQDEGERSSVMNTAASIALGIALERGLFEARIEANLKLNHLGEIGKRSEFTAKITSYGVTSNQYGYVYSFNLKTESGDVIIYKGSKFLGEQNDVLTLKATPSFHGTGDNEFKYTVIKRPTVLNIIEAENKPSKQVA